MPDAAQRCGAQTDVETRASWPDVPASAEDSGEERPSERSHASQVSRHEALPVLPGRRDALADCWSEQGRAWKREQERAQVGLLVPSAREQHGARVRGAGE
jgi:hypothetical protein